MREEKNIEGIDPKTLENGNVLRYLAQRALESREPLHYMQAMNCLRDSRIVLPCEFRMSDSAAKMFMNAKEGDTIAPNESLRFVPDTVKCGDEFYLPVFSSEDQMADEYRSQCSKMVMDFLEALNIADARSDLAGIILDPFTVHLRVSRKLYDFVRDLPSKLRDDSEA